MTDHEPVGGAATAADQNLSTLRYVNGVFKGGGAKGVAYAGALHAVRERGLWFKSVAGASAGAVTATLVASGMGPDDVERAVPLALRSAQASWIKRFISAALGRRSSIYESHGIRDWLDATLRTRIQKTAVGPVTFAELHAATGIELYVLAMDLANSHPMVFSRRTTPDVDVAGAVAASSAIPGAFPAGRGVFMSPANGATVHALVDGGTWANYPSFVFQDRSFRTWLRATSEARTPTTVPPAVFPDRLMLRGALSIVGAMVVVGGLGWWGVNIVDASGVPAILGSLLVGILVGGAAMVYVGGRASALAGARSRLGVMPSDRRRTNTMMVLAAVAGFALIVGGAVLSWVAMQDRNDETSMAIVASGQDDGAYTMEIKGHDTPVTLDNASRLRIGERVFVEVDHTTETATLVGALDDRRFPLAIVMWIMGHSLAISAVRRYRWDVQCRRLAGLAGSIKPADWWGTS